MPHWPFDSRRIGLSAIVSSSPQQHALPVILCLVRPKKWPRAGRDRRLQDDRLALVLTTRKTRESASGTRNRY